MAALDHGVGSVVTARAALHLAITTILSAMTILFPRALFMEAHTLFGILMMPGVFGISTTFVDPRDMAAFSDAIQPNTKLVFGEVLGNPDCKCWIFPLFQNWLTPIICLC